MIEEIRLDTWEEFEKTLLEDIRWVEKNRKPYSYISDMLYRGHANSEWQLHTTLERFSKKHNNGKEYTWGDYHRILQSIVPHIFSFTEIDYKIEDFEKQSTSIFVPPAYEFMVYLRHHGFPSPLLDWTTSPYIAAFFAFFYAELNQDVAIYSYREYLGEAKGGWANDPRISQLGPYVKTHKRHFLQQCQYTICSQDEEKKVRKERKYCFHELAEFSEYQDFVRKYILPSSERKKVLKKLDLMNINEYSLFGNEESLMSTLAYREIENE